MTAEWLRPNQAASYCGISRRTLYVWFKKGLRYVKIGQVRLVRRTDIDEFLLQGYAINENEVDDMVTEILQGVL